MKQVLPRSLLSFQRVERVVQRRETARSSRDSSNTEGFHARRKYHSLTVFCNRVASTGSRIAPSNNSVSLKLTALKYRHMIY
jgi:hypothetical protein